MKRLVARLAAAALLLAPTATADAHGCGTAWVTGYTDHGTTYSGDETVPGWTAAASRNLPLGSVVWIEGLGSRLVNDRGALSVPHNGYSYWIDVSTGTKEEAYALTGAYTFCR